MLSTLFFLLAQGEKAAEKAKDAGERPGLESMLLPFLLMGLVIYFLLIAPGRRQRKQQEQLLSGLKKNDKVMTTAGIIAVVAEVKDDEVTLKIDDNARMRVVKSAIMRILTPREGEPAKSDTSQSKSP
jgi:preprotein translocase subunit YajC